MGKTLTRAEVVWVLLLTLGAFTRRMACRRTSIYRGRAQVQDAPQNEEVENGSGSHQGGTPAPEGFPQDRGGSVLLREEERERRTDDCRR